jgi:L-ascorbate metabolism protein UlaG (beta-lactamase superfamily)
MKIVSKMKKIILLFSLSVAHLMCFAQKSDTNVIKKFQAKAPQTQPFGKEAFAKANQTTLRWMGMSGFLINSRGTILMIDPFTEGFDMPIMIDFPIAAKNVPRVDAILPTHSDNDHYHVPTCHALSLVTKAFHSTIYVDSLMKNEKLPSFGHAIGDVFKVGQVQIKLTPADHAWQNAYHGVSNRFFKPEDACGFWLETPDGSIWAPGDSRLTPDHLKMPQPDVILLDYSEDKDWHFGLEGSAQIVNTYPNAQIILGHWGTVDAPDFMPFNGNPANLIKLSKNPERIHVLAPGEPFILKKSKKK